MTQIIFKCYVTRYYLADLRIDSSRMVKLKVFAMEKLRAGIIGGTGMVGQRCVDAHRKTTPWFELQRHRGQRQERAKPMRAVGAKWALDDPMPECAKMVSSGMRPTRRGYREGRGFRLFRRRHEERRRISSRSRRVCQGRMPGRLEQQRQPLDSDNTYGHPEDNADHLAVIADQKKRLGTKRGFIAVKSTALSEHVPALSVRPI